MRIIASIGAAVAIAFVTLVGLDPAEGSALFNCHLHGNHVCGDSAPWHGFVGGVE